jgi:hypothetical protein
LQLIYLGFGRLLDACSSEVSKSGPLNGVAHSMVDHVISFWKGLLS